MQEEKVSPAFRKLISRIPGDTLEKTRALCLRHARENLPHSSRSILDPALLTAVDDPERAVVIGAGPSLHRQSTLKTLAESRFDGYIVACDSALFHCLSSGVVPHYVLTVDPAEVRIIRWFGDPEIESTLESDDYFERQDYDLSFRQNTLEHNQKVTEAIDEFGPRLKIAISACSAPNVVSRCLQARMSVFWWNPILDDFDEPGSLTREIHRLNGLPCMGTGGNVGAACWVFSHSVLGAKEVALTGMDFSYYDDTPKLNTQYFRNLKNVVGEHGALESDGYAEIFNPDNGRGWYTDPVYYWYRDAFREMVLDAPCKTYNCTGGGILYGERITTMPLAEFARPRSPGRRHAAHQGAGRTGDA
jgi:hypothetical protein